MFDLNVIMRVDYSWKNKSFSLNVEVIVLLIMMFLGNGLVIWYIGVG